MSKRHYVNADWTKLVPEDSPEAAFFIREEDAVARGLLKQAAPKEDKAVKAAPEDKTVTSAKVRPSRQKRR